MPDSLSPRYLTKSRFKLAMECPAKLYYTGKAAYANNKLDDSFLEALAHGGFQVGELARQYYPGGVLIEDIDPEKARRKTIDLLMQDEVIIYEAAFLYKNFFVRTDIVHKHGGQIDVIEVKAKSFDSRNPEFYPKKENGLKSGWVPYFQDIAFQYYVLIHATEGCQVIPKLMLADKSKTATVDGLNQLFRLEKRNGRKHATSQPGLTADRLGDPILSAMDASTGVEMILNQPIDGVSFEDYIDYLAEAYATDTPLTPKLGKVCAKCEFKASPEQRREGLQSGFHECWSTYAGFAESDFDRPLVLDLWNFRACSEFIDRGMYFQEDLSEVDVQPKQETKPRKPQTGMKSGSRRWLQINLHHPPYPGTFLDKPGLRAEMAACRFPLHFIDFETSAVAIPFNAGRHPYEQIAFQYSHHIMEADGSVRHAGEWINVRPGHFPNFDFIRALRTELSTDDGSIFRYSNHENTILNAIYTQLRDSTESDRIELMDWIRTITHATGSSVEKWEGDRDMIDLWAWVKGFYLSPAMKGSNSIKHVLPAMLNESNYLQEKYSSPIYGGAEIPSLNFHNHAWISFDTGGNCINPYKTLPKLNPEFDDDVLDLLFIDEETSIEDGGAAMTAYARMQFMEMSESERTRITEALLRYCELDTLAMVMLWEGWREACR